MATRKKSSKDSIWKQIGIGILAFLCVTVVGLAGYGTYSIVQNCSSTPAEETEDITDETGTTEDDQTVEATAVVSISEDEAVLTVVA